MAGGVGRTFFETASVALAYILLRCGVGCDSDHCQKKNVAEMWSELVLFELRVFVEQTVL